LPIFWQRKKSLELIQHLDREGTILSQLRSEFSLSRDNLSAANDTSLKFRGTQHGEASPLRAAHPFSDSTPPPSHALLRYRLLFGLPAVPTSVE
jgi:hypothetical protein